MLVWKTINQCSAECSGGGSLWWVVLEGIGEIMWTSGLIRIAMNVGKLSEKVNN